MPEPTSARRNAAPAELRPAGESSDPAVHQLLAERQTASANGDAAAVRSIGEQLAKLGFE